MRRPKKPARERRKSPRFQTELRVEVRSGDDYQVHLTKNVSLEGCFIEAETAAAPGKASKVVVYPPGENVGIEFVAEVRNVTARGEAGSTERPPGMGLEIFAMDRREKERWVKLLTKIAEVHEETHGAAEAEHRTADHGAVPSPSRRRFARHSVHMAVDVRDLRSFYRLFSKNMSAGGIYLESEQTLPLATKVEVFLTHPVSKEETAVRGQVMRTDANGFAVKFIGLTEEERRGLLRFALTGRAPDPP